MKRRSFLQLSAAALLSRPALAAESRKLFLFADWFHVKKGDLAVTLDPERISANGRKLLETYARDFNKKFDQTRHGFQRVDIPNGIRIVPEIAEKTQPWLKADTARERTISGASVIFDEGRYRCWYNAQLHATETKFAVDQERSMEVSGAALAYAESKDGIAWTKPSLGILSYKASKDNNLVSPDSVSSSIFRDDHGPKEERYKAFHFAEVSKEGPSNTRYGLYGMSSPDGYHWTKNPKPLIRYFCDTVNVPSWDPELRKYVGFFRNHINGRSISYAETEDFWNWPMPQPLFYPGPMDSPAEDYYTNCYTRYPGDPSLRLLFPAMYHHDTDLVNVRMALSRDGRGYQWSSLDPVIRNGASGAWDAGSIYANPELMHLPDGRLALPYLGYNTTHNEALVQDFLRRLPERHRCCLGDMEGRSARRHSGRHVRRIHN